MQTLPLQDVEALVRLLSECADPTIAIPIVDRKRNLIRGLAKLVDADAFVCTTGRFNPDLPGDAMATSILDEGWANEQERAEAFRQMSDPELQPFVALPFWHAAKHGDVLTMSRQQAFDDATYETAHPAKLWRANGFSEFIISVYPLGNWGYSGLGLHRILGRPPFTERDRVLVHVLMQQVDWIHREGSDVPASDKVVALSPRQRQVLLLMLGGDSRKQLAAKLQLSEHTIVDYIKELYRRFQVKSRSELLSQFIVGTKRALERPSGNSERSRSKENSTGE